MNRKLLLLVFFCTNTLLLAAQQFEVKGIIRDASTKELLIAANITYAPGKGTVTDIDGNFTLQLDSGNYELTVSYVGYATLKQKLKVSKNMRVDFVLELSTLKMVEKTADIARTRETPVAYTNFSAQRIEEDLGSRDLVMVMNSVPSVHATEQGGGAGDARIAIRGFDQRNIAVLVDGVPVNDLESGAVFWSNWSGLADAVGTVQIQRGLGASKLAVASVGGTINMISKGIDNKPFISIKQEVGKDNILKTVLGLNSGLLKGGWGITAAGIRVKGDGYADETWNDMWSYYFKVQKKIGKHLLSLSASGAPQKHGQRTTKLNTAIYNHKYARSIGVNADSIRENGVYEFLGPQGRRYTDSWGEFDRFDIENGDTTHHTEKLNYRVNHFHKPVFNFSEYWNINSKMFLSNIIYLSYGNGGGTGPLGSISIDSKTGQVNFQNIYNSNRLVKLGDTAHYSTTESKSTNYIVDSHNNHVWYGLLSTLNYEISKRLTFMGGADLRSYKGTHYQTVYDFIGGDYVIDTKNNNQPKVLSGFSSDQQYQYQIKHADDRIGYDYYSRVKWGGLFTQFEYKNEDKWSAFVTLSGSQTSYQRFDYFQKRDVVLDDRTFNNIISWGDTLLYNGTDYFVNNSSHHDSIAGNTTYVLNTANKVVATIENAHRYDTYSEESRTSTTREKWYPGYVAKIGANYNIDAHHNVFFNIGHLQIAPRFTSVFDFNNREYRDTKPQLVDAVELGYSYHSRNLAANLNGFYTSWKNKPYSRSTIDSATGLPANFNINGINELHMGLELDFAYKIIKQLTFEGAVSIGDYRYKSGGTVALYGENGDSLTSIEFSAKDVHVGNDPQTQLSGGLRYQLMKGLFIKGQVVYFDKYFTDFDPTLLKGSNADRESWKLPAHEVFDISLGYHFKYWKLHFNISANVHNVFDKIYISDANNGSTYDANSATVYLAPGRRFSSSLKITFQ